MSTKTVAHLRWSVMKGKGPPPKSIAVVLVIHSIEERRGVSRLGYTGRRKKKREFQR
jgi:hypothetical protein